MELATAMHHLPEQAIWVLRISDEGPATFKLNISVNTMRETYIPKSEFLAPFAKAEFHSKEEIFCKISNVEYIMMPRSGEVRIIAKREHACRLESILMRQPFAWPKKLRVSIS